MKVRLYGTEELGYILRLMNKLEEMYVGDPIDFSPAIEGTIEVHNK